MTKRYYKHRETHRKVKGRKQKYCTKCKKWKSVGEFGKDRAKRDRLNIRCKDCYRTYTRALHKKYRKGKKVRVYLRFEERHRIVRGVKQKLCCSCNKWKDESHYSRHRGLKDGLSLGCKECGNNRFGHKRQGARTNLRYEQCHRVVNKVKEKLCRKCRKWKKESEYYKHTSSKDGLSTRCKKCACEATGKSYKPKKKSVRRNLRYENRHRVINRVNQKYCRKCKKWKNEQKFYRDKSKKDGLKDRCKKCSYIRSANTRAV